MKNKETIAIIGVSTGQKAICLKAKELGFRTIAFGWDKNAVCKEIVDKFYPVSILDTDKIVDICINEEDVKGVVSNASDLTAKVANIVAYKLGLNGNYPDVMDNIFNKYYVRIHTKDIPKLSSPEYNLASNIKEDVTFPCIVKPISGSGKVGVSFVKNTKELNEALSYTKEDDCSNILIEEYIDGRELSVESISFHGNHYILQITDKENTGAPHFVETAHHQPSNLNDALKMSIRNIVKKILDNLDYKNGASHIELKIDKENNIFLIEVNPRGGGCEISNQLVKLSTGVDYLKLMIDVSTGNFSAPKMTQSSKYVGIYFLCNQTSELEEFIKHSEGQPYFYQKCIMNDGPLTQSLGNKDRDAYMIYLSDHKVIPQK